MLSPSQEKSLTALLKIIDASTDCILSFENMSKTAWQYSKNKKKKPKKK